MLFVDSKGDSLELDIVDYEFEDRHSSENEFDWDANWLIVKIVHNEDDYISEFKRACILTYELADFARDLDKLKNHKIKSCELEAMEPYLKINVKYDVDYVFNIEYIYNSTTGEKINFTCTANENEMKYYCDETKKLVKKYKKR